MAIIQGICLDGISKKDLAQALGRIEKLKTGRK